MKNEKVDIIIIRGAPGAGKSQVAKGLTKFFPKGVKLEVDNLRQMVISVDWKNQGEHINILQVSTRLVYDFLRLGFKPIIVVDTFSGGKINKYLDSLYLLDKKLLIKIFGLYTTDDELKKRIESRKNDEFRDFKICKRLNKETIEFKYDNEIQIDTTGMLPKDIANKLINNLCE